MVLVITFTSYVWFRNKSYFLQIILHNVNIICKARKEKSGTTLHMLQRWHKRIVPIGWAWKWCCHTHILYFTMASSVQNLHYISYKQINFFTLIRWKSENCLYLIIYSVKFRSKYPVKHRWTFGSFEVWCSGHYQFACKIN